MFLEDTCAAETVAYNNNNNDSNRSLCKLLFVKLLLYPIRRRKNIIPVPVLTSRSKNKNTLLQWFSVEHGRNLRPVNITSITPLTKKKKIQTILLSFDKSCRESGTSVYSVTNVVLRLSCKTHTYNKQIIVFVGLFNHRSKLFNYVQTN